MATRRVVYVSSMIVHISLVLQFAVSGLLAISVGKTSPGPSVKTRYGLVQGLIVSMPSPLGPIEVFLGIPYATPPVGINRFSPTRNPQSWPGTRMTDRHGPACPQRFPTNLSNETESLKFMSKARRDYLFHIEQSLAKNQSEDCLHLNIYAPFQGRPGNTVDRLPVIVFIHGESFDWGSSHLYDGSVLSSYANVVVVTLNFRLGVLGFLNIGRWPKGKPRLANFGLMDQVAALHWIQENIQEFGGDPARVTLVGFGAGAACVHFLMTSPAVVNGLFHRGVMMSGSALASWSLVNDANDVALQVAQAADCVHLVGDRSDSETILNCMRDAPLERIEQAAAKVGRPATFRRFRTTFGPSIDGVVIRGQHLSSPSSSSSGPRKRSEDGRPTYDCLFGVSGFESTFQLSELASEQGLDGVERDLLLRAFVADTYRYHQTEIFLTLVNEYTDWERTTQHPVSIRESTVEALSDGQFVAPAILLGDTLTSPDRNSYFYVIDPAVTQRPQAVHGFELSLVFGSALLTTNGLFTSAGGYSQQQPYNRNYSSKQDASYSEAIMTLFANFARSGNPNEPQDEKLRLSKERNRFKSVVWEPYDKKQRKYMEIGPKPKMKSQFRAHRMAVLLQLLPELQRTGQHDVMQGHGILTPEGLETAGTGSALSLPAWVNGSYVDVTKERTAGTKEVTCVIPQPHTPTASPSTSNATTTVNNSSSLQTTQNGNSGSVSMTGDSTVYSTALSVTIAIGCSLLILNVLTFAGLYYRRDRRRQQQLAQHQSGANVQRSVSDVSHSMLTSVNGSIMRSHTPGETDCETLFLQTPPSSCNGSGTILKSGSGAIGIAPGGTAGVGTLQRQRCCDYVTITSPSAEMSGQVPDRTILDVRYDLSSPIPPDKDFL
ncbi:neuroligin-4, X-linked [Daphnia magna]|uniref:neuroligin-4, X-linked n=1 Tax=Daphnia magna TaxID=35525 RepID=UPI001E1BBDBC|nr:neuroligin-4, X-linked [Daphnia magna]